MWLKNHSVSLGPVPGLTLGGCLGTFYIRDHFYSGGGGEKVFVQFPF